MPTYSNSTLCTSPSPRHRIAWQLTGNDYHRSLSRSSSRPATPPSSSNNPTTTATSRSRTSDVSSPPSRTSASHSSPPFKSYINFLSNTNDDWKADEDEMMGYEDDDGDDFGLPSLSNMKRRTRRIATQNNKPSHGGNDLGSAFTPTPDAFWSGEQQSARRRSNSADIAVERPAPSYPVPKKSEGKILRPQYKEILRGTRPSITRTSNS